MSAQPTPKQSPSNQNPITIFDGGMGRELERRGAPFRQPEWSALALMQAPECVFDVHVDYLQAGADVITINSYALTPFHLGSSFDQQGKSLASIAAKLAYDAVQASHSNAKIAACLPPLFGSYRPDLFDKAQAAHIALPLIEAQAAYADIWLVETISSTAEALTWLEMINHYTTQHALSAKPIWLAFTLDDNEIEATAERQTETNSSTSVRLRSGECIAEAITTILKSNIAIEAILFNCSQPEVMADALKCAKKVLQQMGTNQRLGVYANAFASKQVHKDANAELRDIRPDSTAKTYLTWAQQWHNLGADIIGGCCGIGVEHIALLAKTLGIDQHSSY